MDTKIFPEGSSLVAYLRDSGGPKQELSVTQQEQVIRKWCQDNNYQLTLVFADLAKSGKSTVGRDQFDAMIQHFEAGAQEAGVVFWDYSRWSRLYDDSQFFLAGLRRKGYEAYSLEAKVPTGSTGRVVESLYLWSAEQFREQLSRNVKRGMTYIMDQHHGFVFGNIPTGYTTKDIQIGMRRNGQPHVAHVELDEDKMVAFGAEAWQAVKDANDRDKQLFMRSVIRVIHVKKQDIITGEIILREIPGMGEMGYSLRL